MENRFSIFLLGVGMGIGLGVILMPKSGPETRKLLKAKAGEGADYVSQRGSQMADRAGDMIERGRQVVERQTEKLSDVVEAGKQAFQNI
jgi:gas vesicle protein